MGIWASLVFCSASTFGASELGIRPGTSYKTVESQHNIVHYPDGLESFAARALASADKSYDVLTKYLKYAPTEKTHLVVADVTDDHNGFTLAIPRNYIALFPVPPRPDSILQSEGNWIDQLVLHEYTHAINLDTHRGYSSFFRAIFGKSPANLFNIVLAVPNHIKPRWWHEGIAVWTESKFLPGGRLKSPYTNMIFRGINEANSWLSLDAWQFLPQWPMGNIPYLYGAYFMDELERASEDEFGIGEYSYQSSGDFFTSLNAPLEKITKGKYRYSSDVAQGMIERLRNVFRDQVNTLGTVPFSQPTPLDQSGYLSGFPTAIDGNRFIFSYQDPHDLPVLRIKNFQGKLLDEITVQDLASPIIRVRSDVALVTTQIPDNHGSSFFRPTLVNIKTHRITQIDVRRLSECDFISDKKFICLTTVNASNQLALVNIEGKTPTTKILTRFKDFEILGAPTVNQGNIFFSFGPRDGTTTQIAKFSLETGRFQIITNSAGNKFFPIFFENKLYYTSDINGVFNIYDENDHAITHAKLGFFGGTPISKDQILVSSYSSKGFDPAIIPAKTYAPLPKAVLTNTWKQQQAESETRALPSSRDYSPWSSLRPNGWSPRIKYTSDEGFSMGGWIANMDDLGEHSYKMGARYLTAAGDVDASAAYSYSGWWPTIGVQADRRILRIFNSNYTNTAAAIGMGSPLMWLSRYMYWDASFSQSDRYLKETPTNRVFIRRRAMVRGGLGFKSASRPQAGISDEYGPAIVLNSFTTTGGFFGDRANYNRFSGFLGQGAYYWAPFSRSRHHVIAIYGTYGEIHGNKRQPDLFTINRVESSNTDPPPDSIQPGADIHGFSRTRSGNRLLVTSLEYRFPLGRIDHSLFPNSTFPLFWQSIHMDAGATYASTSFDRLGTPWYSVHGSLTQQLQLFWNVPAEVALEVSRGIQNPDAQTHWEIRLGARF